MSDDRQNALERFRQNGYYDEKIDVVLVSKNILEPSNS